MGYAVLEHLSVSLRNEDLSITNIGCMVWGGKFCLYSTYFSFSGTVKVVITDDFIDLGVSNMNKLIGENVVTHGMLLNSTIVFTLAYRKL